MADVQISIDWIGGNCPVQAEGLVSGKPFYFRARGDSWSFGVGGDPVLSPEWGVKRAWGTGPFDAGWMPQYEALKHIALAIGDYAEWLENKGASNRES